MKRFFMARASCPGELILWSFPTISSVKGWELVNTRHEIGKGVKDSESI